MEVSVEWPVGAQGRVEPRVDLVSAQQGTAVLVHRAELGMGVHVDVDLMRPGVWRRLSLSLSDEAAPLVEALIGRQAVRDLRGRSAKEPHVVLGTDQTDQSDAAPWLRVAMTEALNWWLHAPLDQTLVDAERAVSRGRAARTLPDGPAREAILDDALRQARCASRGVVSFLHRLTTEAQCDSYALWVAVEHLVAGFDELVKEVDGPDDDLAAVGEAWRLRGRARGARRRTAAGRRRSRSAWNSVPVERLASMIDPRQVRARVLALAPDPAWPEIGLAASEVSGSAAVHVRVPAFARPLDPDMATRLAVRLVDRRTAEARGHALLVTRGDVSVLEATVPLWGLDAADVRADVFDVFGDSPPAGTDSDAAIQNARRAVVFLREWRRLAAHVQLSGWPSAPAQRIRDLAGLLRSANAAGDDSPLFAGGPSAAELEALAGLGDGELSARLRYDRAAAGDGLFAVTEGAASLLVAELAAVHFGS